jgi:hypothetical protein
MCAYSKQTAESLGIHIAAEEIEFQAYVFEIDMSFGRKAQLYHLLREA